MKKLRRRLIALATAVLMLCGIALADSPCDHQWSEWRMDETNKTQEVRNCLACQQTETQPHTWGEWMDQGDGTEKHECLSCKKVEFRQIEMPEGTEPEGGNQEPDGGQPEGTEPEGGNQEPDGGQPEGTEPEGGNQEPDGGQPEGTEPEGGNQEKQQAHLVLGASVDNETAKAGDILSFTFTLSNDGQEAATAVAVHVTLAQTLQIVEAPAGYTEGIWTVERLEAGASASLTVRAQVLETAAHGDVLSAVATVANDARAEKQVKVQEAPQLELFCTVDKSEARPGESLTYTVTVVNNGRGPSEGSAVQIVLPESMAQPAATVSDGGSYADGLWMTGPVAAGASASLTLQASVPLNASAGDELTITAALAGVMTLANTGTGIASATTRVTAPRMSIGIAADHTTTATGSVVNFIVTVSNDGNAKAEKVTVTVNLPSANLRLDGATPEEGTSWKDGTWTIPELAEGQKSTLKLHTTAIDVVPGKEIVSSASITEADGTKLATPISDSIAIKGENAAVNLSIVKTADRLSAVPGDEIHYTVILTNTGNAPIRDIRVSEPLHEKLLLTGKEMTQGTIYEETTNVWNIQALEAGQQATLILTTVVLNAREGESIVNTAEIVGAGGYGPDKRPSATASVLVNALDYGFLTVNKTVTGSGASRHRDFPFQVVFRNADGKAVHGVGVYVKGDESRIFDTAETLSFELRHDETVWIGVPAGLTYTVTETDTKGYTCTAKNTKGTILADVLVESSFVNERQRNTEIPKTGYADQAPDADGAQDAPAIAQELEEPYAQNEDFVGWLKAGESIDLPVVQSDNTYYLDHGFTGEEDKNGTLFLNMNNQLLPADDVLLIHGHNMKDGSMFGTLSDFERYDYACEHPVVMFQTIYDEQPVYYAPVSVFNASMLPDHSSYFDITQIVFPDDEEQAPRDSATFRQSSAFKAYLEDLREVSIWNSPVDMNVDDQLLMLITCSYDLEDGRLMVVCRRLREGDTPEDIAALFEK